MGKYELIEAEKANYPIVRMVELLGIARAAYYKWTRRVAAGPSARTTRRADLTGKIADFHSESNGVYGDHGSWPICARPARSSRSRPSQSSCGVRIAGINPARWHPVTTTSDGAVHTIPDIVGRRFDRGVLDEVWTSDITYLRTGEGWLPVRST